MVIVEPVAGTVVEAGQPLVVTVQATDIDGEIRHVEFRLDGRTVFRDNSSPYSWTWDTTGEEKLRHTVTVVVEDDSGMEVSDSVAVRVQWAYAPPEAVGDGWVTSSLADVDLNPVPLVSLVNTLRDTPNHRVHSLLIVRHNQLVFEKYFPGRAHPTWGEGPVAFDRLTPHVLSSVAKSFTATLFGIAVDRGFIASEDEKVFDFFPHLSDLNVGQKGDITLRHLVNMTAGLEWDESSYTLRSGNDLTDMMDLVINDNGDLVRFVLSKPMVAAPGQLFNYSGGLTNVLGRAVQVATDQRLDRFAQEYLFDPMGIDEVWWWIWQDDLVYASGDIALRPRDMAKFGQMYLQGGVWNGVRIVPPGWVEASATADTHFPPGSYWQETHGERGYGLGWWQATEEYGEGAFFASGWGGQRIMILPEHDMVVILTGGWYWTDPFLWPHEIMTEHVLPAIRN
jgi:CubicO group peptidase (beta-lactamase class C family)